MAAVVDVADLALLVEDIGEEEAEATMAAAGEAEAAGAEAAEAAAEEAAAVEDTAAATPAEEDGAVPVASDDTKICQDFSPSPILCFFFPLLILHQ